MPNIEVVIVGAGLAGLSTAFHLAERGATVTLLEKDRVGSGSSSRSGAVNTMLQGNRAATVARGVSFDIFERFDEILDDYTFHQVGCMAIYDEEQFETASQLHDMQREAGSRFDVLDSSQIETRFPDLRIEKNEVGVLALRGGWSAPDSYIPALTKKIVDLGVEVREGVAVEDLMVEAGRVRGVRLAGGEELRPDATVCTVNAWANALLDRIGQPLPVRSFVHERFVTRPFDDPPQLPATNDDANGVYYRPTEDHRILLGSGAMDPKEVRMPGPDFHLDQLSPNPGSLPYILDKVVDRLPAVEGNRIDAHRVGLVSYPADFMPNIGPVEALPGLYLGTNFCSGGFGWHPVAGLLISEDILDERTRIDASIFSPDRFKDFDTQAFLEQDTTYHEMVEAHAARNRGFVRKRH